MSKPHGGWSLGNSSSSPSALSVYISIKRSKNNNFIERQKTYTRYWYGISVRPPNCAIVSKLYVSSNFFSPLEEYHCNLLSSNGVTKFRRLSPLTEALITESSILRWKINKKIAVCLGNGSTQSHSYYGRLTVADQCVSLSMTLSDLKRRDARGPGFPADAHHGYRLSNRDQLRHANPCGKGVLLGGQPRLHSKGVVFGTPTTIISFWPRRTKFDRKEFLRSYIAQQLFWNPNIHLHRMTQSNQIILQGDQIRWGKRSRSQGRSRRGDL